MKILFLHLSDLHIKDNSQLNIKIDKIISATQTIENVEKCIIICSGDLAFSGKEDEYKHVRIFLGTLLKKFGESRKQYIESYIVPGNHDMILNFDSRTSSDILSYLKEGKEDEYFNLELK